MFKIDCEKVPLTASFCGDPILIGMVLCLLLGFWFLNLCHRVVL